MPGACDIRDNRDLAELLRTALKGGGVGTQQVWTRDGKQAERLLILIQECIRREADPREIPWCRHVASDQLQSLLNGAVVCGSSIDKRPIAIENDRVKGAGLENNGHVFSVDVEER